MASDKAENPVKSPNRIIGFLPSLFGILAAVSAGLLFAGLYDLGQFGIQSIVSEFAVVAVSIFVLCSIASMVMDGKSGGSVPVEGEAMSAKFDELRSTTTSRLMNFQSAIDAMSGQDRESLIEENKWLKEQLDAVQNAERQKVVDEVEQLRSQNAILEEKIKKWAIQTVDAAMEDDKAENQNAA